MSEPTNHHFVSQVHLKNFFNSKEQKIYVYDKIRDNHYSKTTTKSLFSEQKLNSRYKDGIVDHVTIEKDLNDFFEKDFSNNTEIIKQFIIDEEFTNEVNSALFYFAKYGIIGDMRTPRFKKQIDDSIEEAFKPLLENAAPSLKEQMKEMFDYKNEVKYSNSIEYSEIADKAIDLMGELIFQILIPENENEYFIIPDFSAGTSRAKINKYFNPDVEEIAYISLPLSSKIYIHFYSAKLFDISDRPISKIMTCTSRGMEIYNGTNLDYCQDKIACENEDYLKSFITKNKLSHNHR